MSFKHPENCTCTLRSASIKPIREGREYIKDSRLRAWEDRNMSMNHEPSSSIFIRSRPRMGMCLCVCELALASRCLVASAPMSLTAARGEGKGGVDPLCRFKTPRVRISCPLTRSILGGTARTSQSRWRPLTLHAEKNINFRFAAIVSICD